MPKSTTSKRASASDALYQLKITLRWSQSAIWRRVLVRADIPLDRLHDVIQIAMGWTDSHLHQFITGTRSARICYGQTDPEFGDLEGGKLDERRYTVADIAPAARGKFIYKYDFGDGWEHEVVIERILPPDAGFAHSICLAGERACPPEDCGGIPGYENLCGILADPKHPEHEAMKGWLGDDLDPEAFDLKAVNAQLKRYRA
jgi:hypothetical protein